MFCENINGVSKERMAFNALLKQYRRPCFYGGVNVSLTKDFVTELIELFNTIWDGLPRGSIFCELDVIIKEILSDINYEINVVSKKAGFDFRIYQGRLRPDGVKEWETISSSHPLIC